MAYHISVALIVLCQTASFGQNSKIIGKIFLDDSKACDACVVQLLDSKGLNLVSFKYSDQNGYFDFDDLKDQADYKVNIYQFGYRDTTVNIFRNRDKINYITASLNQLSFNIDEISIVDKVALLKKSGDTTTFNLRLLKKGNELSTTDMINRLPGIDIDDEKISYHGKTIDKLLIDNVDLSDENHTSLTNNICFENVKNIKILEHYNQYNSYEIDSTELGVAMLIDLKDDVRYKPQVSMHLNAGYKNAYQGTASMIKLSRKGGLRIHSGMNNTNKTIHKFDKSEYIKSVRKDVLFRNRYTNISQSNEHQDKTYRNENSFEKTEHLLKIIATRNIAEFSTIKSTNSLCIRDNKSEVKNEQSYFLDDIRMNENVSADNNYIKITSHNELQSTLKKNTLCNVYLPIEIDKNIEHLDKSLSYNSNNIKSKQNSYFNSIQLNPHFNLDYKKKKLSIQFKGRMDYSKLDRDNLFETEEGIVLRDDTRDSINEFSQRIIYESTSIHQQFNVKSIEKFGYVAYNASMTHSAQNLIATSKLMLPEDYIGSDSLVNFNTNHAMHFHFDTKKVRFTIGGNYYYWRQDYDQIHNKSNGFSPYIFAMLKLNSKWNISSSYKNTIVQSNLRQISPLWLIRDLQTLHSGSLNSLQAEIHNTLNLSFFRNIETGDDSWQFNTSLSYDFPYNAIISTPIQSNSFVHNENTQGLVRDNYNFSTYLGRYYRNFNFSMRSNMGFNTIVSHNQSYSRFFRNLSTSVKYKLRNLSFHSTCTLNMLDVELESYNLKARTLIINSRVFHEFKRVKQSLGLQISFNSNNENETLFPNLSYSCKYIPKNNHYELSLTANNFLNLKNAYNTSISNHYYFSELSEFRMQPGNLLVGIKFFL